VLIKNRKQLVYDAGARFPLYFSMLRLTNLCNGNINIVAFIVFIGYRLPAFC